MNYSSVSHWLSETNLAEPQASTQIWSEDAGVLVLPSDSIGTIGNIPNDSAMPDITDVGIRIVSKQAPFSTIEVYLKVETLQKITKDPSQVYFMFGATTSSGRSILRVPFCP